MENKKFTVVKASNPVEWIMSGIITIQIMLISLCGILVDVLEYKAKYYDDTVVVYKHAYHFLPPCIMFLYFLYFYLRLWIQKKLKAGEVIRLSWDMVLGGFLFLLGQALVINNMNIKVIN